MPNLITQDVDTEVRLVATGGQTVFSYPFAIFEESDLIVLKNGTEATLSGAPLTSSQYSVSGVGDSAGGAVTFGAGLTAGDIVVLSRDVPVKRSIDIPTAGPFAAEIIDDEFDRVMAILQQLRTEAKRSLSVPVGSPAISFPAIPSTSGMFLGTALGGTLSWLSSGPSDASALLTSVMQFIPSTLWSAIKSSTNTVDLYPYLQAAIDSFGVQGGVLYFPPGHYRSSQRLVITEGVNLLGSHITSNPGNVAGTGYTLNPPNPTAYQGSVLVFDKTAAGGIICLEYTDDTVGQSEPIGYTNYEYASARWSRIENLILVGQADNMGGGVPITTPVTQHGLETRTVIRARNLYITRFGGDGVHIAASSNTAGGPNPADTNVYGNASQCIFDTVACRDNNRHGFHILSPGRDANVITFLNCDGALNGGWNFYDNGFLGTNYIGCHSSVGNRARVGNSSDGLSASGTPVYHADYYTGSFFCGSAAANIYLGCYIEQGLGQDASLTLNCSVIGGNMAGEDFYAADAPCHIVSGGVALRRPHSYQNSTGAQTVYSALGMIGATKTVLTFGSQDDDAGQNAWRLSYNFSGADKWWGLCYGGDTLSAAIQFPSSDSTANRTGAGMNSNKVPAFPNGFMLNGDGFGGTLMHVGHASGAALPNNFLPDGVTPNGADGDIAFQRTPASGRWAIAQKVGGSWIALVTTP